MNFDELEKIQKLGIIIPKIQLNIPISISEAQLVCGDIVSTEDILKLIAEDKILTLTVKGTQYINGKVLIQIINKQLTNATS